MKKLNKSLLATIFVLVLTLMLSVSAFAANELDRIVDLKASEVTNNSVTLTWSPISGASGYRVQRCEVKGTSQTAWEFINAAVTTTSFTDRTLQIGKTYKYRVQAYKASTSIFGSPKYGSYSVPVSVSNTLGKVTGLKVASTTPTKVKLTWTAVSGADGYLVQKQVAERQTDQITDEHHFATSCCCCC